MKTSSYIEWCNENQGRLFPIDDNVTCLDDYGFTLKNDLIVDLSIVVPRTISNIYLSSFYLSNNLITVSISANVGGILIGTYLRHQTQQHVSYPLVPVIDNVSGWITFGNIFNYTKLSYRFSSSDQSRIADRAIRIIDPPGVISFYNTVNQNQVTDIINLKSSDDLIIERDPINPRKIIIRLDPAAQTKYIPESARRLDESSCGATPIRRINNVTADETGIITIRFV